MIRQSRERPSRGNRYSSERVTIGATPDDVERCQRACARTHGPARDGRLSATASSAERLIEASGPAVIELLHKSASLRTGPVRRDETRRGTVRLCARQSGGKHRRRTSVERNGHSWIANPLRRDLVEVGAPLRPSTAAHAHQEAGPPLLERAEAASLLLAAGIDSQGRRRSQWPACSDSDNSDQGAAESRSALSVHHEPARDSGVAFEELWQGFRTAVMFFGPSTLRTRPSRRTTCRAGCCRALRRLPSRRVPAPVRGAVLGQ